MQTKSILNRKHTFLVRVVLTVILLVFSGNCSYSESLRENLRNYLLVRAALQFNTHLRNNEWSEAASVAHLYSLTIPILGIGNTPLTGFQSGNTYSSAREFFAADLIAYTAITKDFGLLFLGNQMIPNDVTDPRLYFNLACLYAIQRDKEEMLHNVAIALRLGQSPKDFLTDSDFDGFKKDPDFIRIVTGRSAAPFSK
ncbi:conserved exported hypothetical protein [Leptospira interrogans serovar Manilae]|uniref:Uncharacterized protein n=1 Tax=Leptospira interrogans serovar Manilae TaxID=214675 RepID=A0AAQ1P2L7_LEPIR|nr:hypothetical protein [Leptospira interrogans]AKP25538.1 hypothetical protein LIMLP_06035 [Leptospira interrogans serovar Manilae]AKP29323.1 hypothetical protein LIMHP_06025 [Leptospira interrogans serovar Manilae]EYU62109.1 hypothetical protein CI00_01330 [Leptospira interrogans serovar Manilae]SOR63781.1 conserved exported hypothetical protein [Leptospira interrogans serovar Manilae]